MPSFDCASLRFKEFSALKIRHLNFTVSPRILVQHCDAAHHSELSAMRDITRFCQTLAKDKAIPGGRIVTVRVTVPI